MSSSSADEKISGTWPVLSIMSKSCTNRSSLSSVSETKNMDLMFLPPAWIRTCFRSAFQSWKPEIPLLPITNFAALT